MAQNVTTPGDPIVDVNARNVESFHDYDLSRVHRTTNRFGEIDVLDNLYLNPGETAEFGNQVSIDSFTLGQRFMTRVHVNRAAFFVPLRAMLPLNYEKAVAIPNVGDDVPLTPAETLMPSVTPACLGPGMFGFPNNTSGTPITDVDILKKFMRFFSLVMWKAGNDSLLSKLELIPGKANKFQKVRNRWIGVSAGARALIEDNNVQSISDLLRVCIATLKGYIDVEFGLADGSVTDPVRYVRFSDSLDIKVIVDTTQDSNEYLTLPWCYIPEMVRLYGGAFTVLRGELNADYGEGQSQFNVLTYLNQILQYNVVNPLKAVNIMPLIAYQMTMAKFYTNDQVDDVYSTETFLALVKSLERVILGDTPWPTFEQNGVTYEHDALSGAVLSRCLQTVTVSPTETARVDARFRLHMLLFAKQNSLIFKDFVTGARPAPIAVGTTTVDVVDNKVDVIDINKNTQVQRLLNFIQALGRRFPNYLAKLTGANHVADPVASPQLLVTMRTEVFGSQIENTAEAQITKDDSITTVLHSSDGNLRYTFTADDYGYLLILQSYDYRRLYVESLSPFAGVITKYDLYNPFLQYQGDQSLSLLQLGYDSDNSFGYVTRDLQYKTRYDIATGAFDSRLKDYAAMYYPSRDNGINIHISPAFIRARTYEFDRFFTALTSPLLSERFHFIVESTTFVNVRRNMVPRPQILG